MSVGRTVRLYLAEGVPTGILIAEIMNWTGHVLVAPRSKLAKALERPEASRTGLYILVGDDPDVPNKLRVYVGEGDSVIDRLKAHAKDTSKEFWGHAYIVTSKDANLTKAHVRYLESRLVDLAKSAERASVANGNEPGLKQLPESDIADMEFFLTQLQIVLPVLGIDLFRPKPTHIASPVAPHHLPAEPSIGISLTLFSKKLDVKASAVELDGEVTVYKGSQATKSTFISNIYGNLRQALIDDGTLVFGDATRLLFAKDAVFASPSAAAAVILNRNSNGRVEWRLTGSGQTLKEWQEAQLANA